MSLITVSKIQKETSSTNIDVPSTGQFIDLASAAQGDVLYYNGTSYVRLAPGTSGQVLTSGGAGANPSWGAAPADNAPSFAAYNPADQSLTTGAYNKMTATTEVYDTGSCYDAANAKFTVPAGEAGKYVVWTRSSVSTGGTSALIHQLGNWMYLNGSASEKIYWGTPANSTVSAAQTFMGVFDLSAADYVEWYIWVSFSSGTITTSSGPAYSQWGAFKLAGV